MKKFPMTLTIKPDYNDPYYAGAHILQWDHDNFKGKFLACNMDDCPEDAILDRDLFNAYDYLEAVKFGMELARKGYTDIELTEIEGAPF